MTNQSRFLWLIGIILAIILLGWVFGWVITILRWVIGFVILVVVVGFIVRVVGGNADQ